MAFITPDAHLLESIRVGPTNLVALLAEAFDNAFDAAARNIGAGVSEDAITVIDDGKGIARSKFLALVTPGAHAPSPDTKLGIYGIGVKYHAIRWGDDFAADTTTEDGRRSLQLNWKDVQRRKWEIEDPVEISVRDALRTGTCITISSLKKNFRKDETTKAREKLALLFQPALADGRSITINSEPVTAPADPELMDIVDETVILPSGREVHIRGGLLVKPGKLYQVHVAYQHRVILETSLLGVRDYPARDMFARVRLHGTWKLAEFKDGIPDDEYDELEERVYTALQPVLEKCKARTMSARTQEAGEWLNANLPEELTPVRPVRKGEKKMPKEKRHEKGGERKIDAPSEPTGPIKDKRKNGLQIEFVKGLAEEIGCGKFHAGQRGQPHKVQISEDDPAIAAWLRLPDARRELGFAAIKQIALMLYDDGIQSKTYQLTMWPSDDEEFELGRRLSRLFARQESVAMEDRA